MGHVPGKNLVNTDDVHKGGCTDIVDKIHTAGRVDKMGETNKPADSENADYENNMEPPADGVQLEDGRLEVRGDRQVEVWSWNVNTVFDRALTESSGREYRYHIRAFPLPVFLTRFVRAAFRRHGMDYPDWLPGPRQPIRILYEADAERTPLEVADRAADWQDEQDAQAAQNPGPPPQGTGWIAANYPMDEPQQSWWDRLPFVEYIEDRIEAAIGEWIDEGHRLEARREGRQPERRVPDGEPRHFQMGIGLTLHDVR